MKDWEIKDCSSSESEALEKIKKFFGIKDTEINIPSKKKEDIKEYYKDGNFKREVYDNERLTNEIVIDKEGNGVSKQYYDNGNLSGETEIQACVSQGFYKSYYYNGQLYVDGFLKNGKLEKIYNAYNEDGQLMSEEEKEKLLETTNEVLSIINNPVSENKNTEIISSKKEEEIEKYYEDGRFKREFYDNERLTNEIVTNKEGDQLHKEYYENGQLKKEVIFTNKEGNQLHKEYYENGQLKEERFTTKEGEQLHKEYYENGQLKEDSFTDEQGNGDSKRYHENGKLGGEIELQAWVPHGSFKTYYVNGQLYIDALFKNGKLEKIYNAYNEDGQLKSEEEKEELSKR